MRLPRSVSGQELVRALARIGYRQTRQSGSHVRLTHPGPPEHHVTVPNHDAIRLGTLSAVVATIAEVRRLSKDDVVNLLFG